MTHVEKFIGKNLQKDTHIDFYFTEICCDTFIFTNQIALIIENSFKWA